MGAEIGVNNTRGILKVKGKSKLPQEWQIYQGLTYEEQWKPIIEEEWKKYQAEWEESNPDTKLPQHCFAFMNSFLKAKYAEESEEYKKDIQAHREKLRDERDQADVKRTTGANDRKRNEEFQE